MDFGIQCVALGDGWSRSTVSAVPNVEVAVLDSIARIIAERAGRRVRFVVKLPRSSPLWQHTDEIAGDVRDWWIDRPDHADQPMLDAAVAMREPHAPAPPPLVPLLDGVPMVIATDGSVRDMHAGFGWLTSSGEYGLANYRSRSRTVGTEPVLVAELCAIGDAVCQLPGRRLTILCDNRRAVDMVRRWISGDPVLPVNYPTPVSVERALHVFRRRIYADGPRLEIGWVRGHSGHALNEGADALARLASRQRRGDSDLRGDGYARRAAGIAEAFAAEFRRAGALTG
ncbi:RNase H family protein [Mycobacterium sp. C31M]